MRLKNKSYAIIGSTSILYLACLFFILTSHGLNTHSIITLTVAASIIYSIIMASAIYAITLRINKLNQSIKLLNSQDALSQRIVINGDDELNSIAAKINELLNKVDTFQQNSQQLSENTIKELVEDNIHLQQKLSAKTRSDKFMVDSEYLKQLGQDEKNMMLPNRIYFNEILNKAITYSKRRNQFLSILLIDLDLFKVVKNTLGKDNGDLILKEIGKRFANVLRKEDILAKLDEDEYIVLLNDIRKPKFTSMVAEKLLNICSQTLKIDSQEFTLTASIGISIYPNDGASLEELVENADQALFKAKQAGGNTYQFHTEEIHVEALEYIQLESALRKAIHNNELALYYQPKFRLKTGTIVAVEALMRWEHPVLGIIHPAKFIQIAEESGLIMQIGEWALREACQRFIYWKNEGYEHITIALKLSPQQFNHPDLIKMLTKVFSSFDMNPQYIELEIAERTVMENVELSSSILEQIKETGVRISIDHFGTGYTSINYLKKLPISAIKIDKSYIKGIPNNPNDVAITGALIGLAHNLGLEVVAEGIESAEQVQYLSSQNCDTIQGYFLSHPVTAQKIVMQLKKLSEEVLV